MSITAIRNSTLAARERLSDTSIGVTVKGGSMRIVRVTFPKGKCGASTVTPLSDYMPASEIVAALDAL